MTDRNNQLRTFEFDGLNRQTHERWIGVNNSVLRDMQSSYDAAGQLVGMSDPDSTYAFTYDALGRLKSVDNAGTPGVTAVKLTYDYDGNGNVKSVLDAINGQAAGMTSYAFDALNRVSQITQSGTGVQSKRVNFAYNSVGQMQSLKRYSDLGGAQLVAQTGYSYDSLNRLSQINHQNAGGGSLAFYRFGYDAAGRIQQTVDIDGTTDFTYDKTSQLTGADRAGTVRDESYAYDANGNRTNAGYSTGTDNRLNSDGVFTYTYDFEGNLKTRTRIGTSEVRTFNWDYRNRLTGVSDSTGGATTYTYDGMNQRIAKSVGGTTTRFVYDRGNVVLEFTGNAIPSVRYLHGTMVDQVLAQEKGGQTSWMLTDQLGSVRDLVSDAGEVVGHFTYDSFGQVVSAVSSGTVDSRYKFTGRELDSETGLYYYRARYYDAKVGKFIGQDPIGFQAGDANLYRYVGNRSTDRVDPSGKFSVATANLMANSRRRPDNQSIAIYYQKLGDYKEALIAATNWFYVISERGNRTVSIPGAIMPWILSSPVKDDNGRIALRPFGTKPPLERIEFKDPTIEFQKDRSGNVTNAAQGVSEVKFEYGRNSRTDGTSPCPDAYPEVEPELRDERPYYPEGFPLIIPPIIIL